jgi:transposase
VANNRRSRSAKNTLRREFNGFEKRLRALARSDTRARLLISTPGVGTIVALTYAAAIDDPSRFKSSKIVGGAFRADADQVSVRRDRPDRPDLQDRRRRGPRGARIQTWDRPWDRHSTNS